MGASSRATSEFKPQHWIPNLHPSLKKALRDEHSPLSKVLTNIHSKHRIGDVAIKFSERKPSLGARLRLLYLYVVVNRNHRAVFKNAFRIDSDDLEFSPKKEQSGLGSIHPTDQSMLCVESNHDLWSEGLNLTLKPWEEAWKAVYKKVFDSNEQLNRCFAILDKHQEHVLSTSEMEFYIAVKEDYVVGNYIPLKMLRHQFTSKKTENQIERRMKNFDFYKICWAKCEHHFNSQYRNSQFTYMLNSHKKRESDSLTERFGINSYGEYISRLLNGYWIHYSETIKHLHHTMAQPKRKYLKGIQGRGNGWSNLVAAFVMRFWDEDRFRRFKSTCKGSSVAKSFPDFASVQSRVSVFQSNFEIVENTKKATRKAPDPGPELDDSPPTPTVVAYGRALTWKNIHLMRIDHYYRTKSLENVEKLRKSVLRRETKLAPFFHKKDCEYAERSVLDLMTYQLANKEHGRDPGAVP